MTENKQQTAFAHTSKDTKHLFRFKECIKVSRGLACAELEGDFTLKTQNGVFRGKKGDFLIVDRSGQFFLRRRSHFYASYYIQDSVALVDPKGQSVETKEDGKTPIDRIFDYLNDEYQSAYREHSRAKSGSKKERRAKEHCDYVEAVKHYIESICHSGLIPVEPD